jgi:hypothetical protein
LSDQTQSITNDIILQLTTKNAKCVYENGVGLYGALTYRGAKTPC